MKSEDLSAGIARLAHTFRVLEEPRLIERAGFWAGDDEVRLAVMQRALDHPQVAAVLAARGGYGTTRILDRIDWERVLRAPRWLVGSSDLTAILVYLWARFRLLTIHGPMVARFPGGDGEDFDTLMTLLQGGDWQPPPGLRGVVSGAATGPLLGGNLCLLAHLAGTVSPDAFDGAILFLEEVSEAPYRVDRMLTQLARAGFLRALRGVVLGHFTHCAPQEDGVTARDVLLSHFRPYGIPVVENYPAAHGGRNYPFVHGGRVALCVDEALRVQWRATPLGPTGAAY